MLQLLRSGSPELKALLGKAKPQNISKAATSSSAETSPGPAAAKSTKGRWRDKPAARQQKNDGWITVSKAKKPKAEKQEEPKVSDELLQEGISVPVKASFAEMSTNDSGICLCSTSEAKRALAMMWSDKPAAVLSPTNVEGRGVERDVLVKDKDGRIQRRPRFVFQLGYGAVEFARVAPKKNVSADSVRMVLNMHEDSPESWKLVLKDPILAAKRWFEKHVKTGLLETRPPTRTPGTAGLQVLVYVAQASSAALLRASGADHVYTREFYESDADRAKFRIVPCQENSSAKAAREQASHMGDEAFGVVRTKRGFGIRVRSENYEAVMMRLRPDDAQQFLGDRWEISGLPVTTGAEAVKAFVQGWDVHPLFSFRQGWRRTWVVRAAIAPQQRVVEHQSGFAVLQEYHPRRAAPSVQKERWSPPKRTSAVHTTDFPPLRPPKVNVATAEAPARDGVSAPSAASPSLGLKDRITQAVAAAIAPISAQLAALQAGVAATGVPHRDAEMAAQEEPGAGEAAHEEDRATTQESSEAVATEVIDDTNAAPSAVPTAAAAPVPSGPAAAVGAGRSRGPSSYADRSTSAPYSPNS